MRMTALILAGLLAGILPVQAMTVTARVSGGNIAIHAGPDDSYPIVGRVADGTEIPIDECTQVDGDSRFGTLDKYVPTGDFVVVKFARWAFEKFKGVEDKLGHGLRIARPTTAL